MQLNATAPILALYANPEACLKKDFRVKRSSVAYLVQMLSSPKDHGWGQDIEVLVLLYSLAHGLSLSVVSSAFGIPKSTVHRITRHVIGKIKANLKTLISLPTAYELPEIGDGFYQLAKSPAFHRAAGAIHGCHIRIKPSGNEYHKDCINYKLFLSIQMQAICDSTGRFLDVFIGYPGSVHDARVLRNSPIFCQALFPPAGWFLEDYSMSLMARCRPDSTRIMPGLGVWWKEHLEG
ncbi:protein ALP1-like [Gymnodraco acuticeps]|uniref:Protein ALP1-like n=1 Tax=Gymnodraco acuticeps TaxID=8218 RepID=A0A6P8UE38_GYMAC|nr:protein ALP1-like [Gymnodraco acuticeps]